MTGRIEELWHMDAKGQKNPNHLVDKQFLHVKSATLYVVIGFTLNACTDEWALIYDRADERRRGKFHFTRDMAEFLDGRFVEVK